MAKILNSKVSPQNKMSASQLTLIKLKKSCVKKNLRACMKAEKRTHSGWTDVRMN